MQTPDADGYLPGAAVRQTEALDAMQRVLDGTEWSADTLDEIADILRDAGYTVSDV